MVLPVVGGLVGRWASAGDRKRQREMEDRALRGYDDLQAPQIDPLEQRHIDRSMYTNLPNDAASEALTDEALAGMAEEARTGGLGAQGRLGFEQARLQSAANANRANTAIQQNAARRGMGGAGSLVAQQVAQQGANATASLAGMQAAANAENRRMAATQALGGMAGATAGRRNAAAMERARQIDAINRFEANMGYQTDMANRGFQQQNFQNNLGLTDRRYDALQRRAGQYGRDADATAGMWYNIGQGLQDTGMAIGQTMMGMPPTAAMGGGGGAFTGAGASGSAGPMMYPSAGSYPGPVQAQYDPQLFATEWWNMPGYR